MDEDEGLLLHVIDLRKGKSVSVDGDLQLFDFNDPAAPPEAWTTYNYTVVLPEIDPDMPYKLLLSRTKAPAAKQMNLTIKKNVGKAPAWHFPFSMTIAKRSNPKGTFYVPRVVPVTPIDENVKIAEALANMVVARPEPTQVNEPAI